MKNERNWFEFVEKFSGGVEDFLLVEKIPTTYIPYALMLWPFGDMTYNLLNNPNISLTLAHHIVTGAINKKDHVNLIYSVRTSLNVEHNLLLVDVLRKVFYSRDDYKIKFESDTVDLIIGKAFLASLKTGLVQNPKDTAKELESHTRCKILSKKKLFHRIAKYLTDQKLGS